MPLTDAGKNTAATEVGAAYTWLALYHSDGSELVGAGYTRIQYTPGAAAAGVVSIPATGPFNVPSASNVTSFGIWSLQSGGVEGGKEPLSAATGAYAADGEFNFTGGTITVTSA